MNCSKGVDFPQHPDVKGTEFLLHNASKVELMAHPKFDGFNPCSKLHIFTTHVHGNNRDVTARDDSKYSEEIIKNRVSVCFFFSLVFFLKASGSIF